MRGVARPRFELSTNPHRALERWGEPATRRVLLEIRRRADVSNSARLGLNNINARHHFRVYTPCLLVSLSQTEEPVVRRSSSSRPKIILPPWLEARVTMTVDQLLLIILRRAQPHHHRAVVHVATPWFVLAFTKSQYPHIGGVVGFLSRKHVRLFTPAAGSC